MTEVLQYLASFLRGQDVTQATNTPNTVGDTAIECPQPLNLGTIQDSPLVEKGATARSVNIYTCSGKQFPLVLGPSTTVEELKFKVQQQTGYPTKSIDLVFGIQTLEKGFDLGRLNANANLLMVHKVHRGGCGPMPKRT